MQVSRRRLILTLCGALVGATLPPAGHAHVMLFVGAIEDQRVSAILAESFNATLFSATNQLDRGTQENIEIEGDRLQSVLHSLGYLGASISIRASHIPSSVILEPVTGPLYRIGAVELAGIRSEAVDLAVQGDIGDSLQKYAGSIASSDTFAKLEEDVLWRLRDAGHAFAEIIRREVASDQLTELARVRFAFQSGSRVQLGSLRIRGLHSLDPETIEQAIHFSAGSLYSPELMNDLREQLAAFPGIRSVDMEIGDRPDVLGLHDVQVNLREEPRGELLDTGRLAGFVFWCALGALAFRQICLAAAGDRRLEYIRVLNIASMVAMAMVITISVHHVLAFVNI